jgi:hypothetical protein
VAVLTLARPLNSSLAGSIVNKCVKIKIVILIIIGISTILGTSESIRNEPPLFLYPIVALIVFLGSLAYFKAASTQRKLTIGNMASFSIRLLIDPLPFFHFIGLAAFMSGICIIGRDLIRSNTIEPMAFISLSFAIGLLPGVLIANKKFIVK